MKRQVMKPGDRLFSTDEHWRGEVLVLDPLPWIRDVYTVSAGSVVNVDGKDYKVPGDFRQTSNVHKGGVLVWHIQSRKTTVVSPRNLPMTWEQYQQGRTDIQQQGKALVDETGLAIEIQETRAKEVAERLDINVEIPNGKFDPDKARVNLDDLEHLADRLESLMAQMR